MVRNSRLALLIYLIAGLAGIAPANAAVKVKVGILKFGTVSWALDAMRNHGFDKAEGIELEIVPLASTQATELALRSGSVDYHRYGLAVGYSGEKRRRRLHVRSILDSAWWRHGSP
jgi:ABC-type nitrate/sulfonate/bicarbonate transport system substrate-binding protein